MTRLKLAAAFLLVSAAALAHPPEKDSNVVISSASEVYAFQYNKKASRVEVAQKLSRSYLCNSFRTALPVVEMYDNETTIDNVEILVDGRELKSVKPAYEYYSIDNIFFSDARICYFELPLQKQGGTGEVRFEKTVTDPRYFTSIYFTEAYKVRQKQVTVKVPRWMKAELKEMNFAGNNITKATVYDAKADADVYTYTITNAEARASERNSPGPTYLYPHLMVLAKSAAPSGSSFTYFNTLDDQYAWYRSLVKSVVNDAAVLKAKAQEITAGKTTDLEKIKAVFYWVQQNIRYIAFEDGLAGFRPEKAHEVLRRKYGDCKGMAHLTKELLKSLGLDARLCWIGTNHIAYDYGTPSMSVDNHMICAVNQGGKMVFLDATETYSGFGEYAERIQGRQVLVEDGDKYVLSKIPATTYQQNLETEKMDLSLNGTALVAKVEREWQGEEKAYMLMQLNSIKKDKSKDALLRYLADDNKDCTIQNLVTSDVEDFDKHLSLRYDMALKNGVSNFGKEYYVDLDFRKEFGGFLFDLAERKHDYWFRCKTNLAREVHMTLPAGFTATSVPAGLAVKNSDYEFSIAYQQLPNKIVYKKTILIKNPRLAKSKFAQWNADVEKLAKAYNEQLVLTAK